jgi:V8-like Glu-specific endopeptidase
MKPRGVNHMKYGIWKLTRILTLIIVVSACFVGTLRSTPVYAITNGQPDEDGHPYVCCVVMFDESGQFVGSASGVLISPDIVLTAGHVTEAGPYAFVTFSPEVQYGNLTGYVFGFPYTHPDYEYYGGPETRGSLTHDVGIIELSEPFTMTEYGALPNEGVDDTLAPNTMLDIVGYGYNYRERPSQQWLFYDQRYYAQSELIASKDKQSDEFIKITCNPAQGKGGMSFGDSGGPILLGGTNTVLGLVSYGTNFNSAGVGYAARIDTADVLDWINSWLL